MTDGLPPAPLKTKMAASVRVPIGKWRELCAVSQAVRWALVVDFLSPCPLAHWLMRSNNGHPFSQQCWEYPGRGINDLKWLKSFTDVRLLNSTASSLFVMHMLICFSVLRLTNITLRMGGSGDNTRLGWFG